MITKEEIEAKLSLMNYLNNTCVITLGRPDCYPIDLNKLCRELQNKLETVDSIKDLLRKAFNAANLTVQNPDFDLDEDERLYIPKYDDFDDYFKSMNNEK